MGTTPATNAALTYMKGRMYEMTPENREKREAAKKELDEFIDKHGEAGIFALALIGLERQSDE